MSEEEQNAKEFEYQKYFNDGYVVGVYDETLACKLSQLESEDIKFDGFKEGLQQGLRERDKSISREEELDRIRKRGIENGRDVER